MIVLGADGFSKKLASLLNVKYNPLEKRVFPDKEVCPRVLQPIDDEHVVFANRMQSPGFDPNTYFIESLLVIKFLKRLCIPKIDFVMPYMVYSRQDKQFREGEPFSADKILETFADAGATRIFVVTSHYQRGKEILPAKIPVININGYEAICNHIRSGSFEKPVITGPDFSESLPVKALSGELNCESLVFEKERNLSTGNIEMKADVKKGRNIILIDDEISSGSTMIKAMDLCRKAGSKSVSVFAVHGKFAGDSLVKIKELADNLAVSDTIETPVSCFSVAELIAEKIKDA